MLNFRLLGSIIKKKYLKVTDPLNVTTTTLNRGHYLFLLQDLKDSSQTARVLFALPVDDPDDGGAPWDRYKCLYCGATTKLFSAVIEHIRQVSLSVTLMYLMRNFNLII